MRNIANMILFLAGVTTGAALAGVLWLGLTLTDDELPEGPERVYGEIRDSVTIKAPKRLAGTPGTIRREQLKDVLRGDGPAPAGGDEPNDEWF